MTFPEKDVGVQEAKRLVAGPLGEELNKFPLRFAKALYFGGRPSQKGPSQIYSATATFVNLGSGPMAVTCKHVIDSYRAMAKSVSNIVFQIGDVDLDPLKQLIDEEPNYDLATIRLTAEQVSEVTKEAEIGNCIFQPGTWPVERPAEKESVAFGGYPGKLRERPAQDKLIFNSWSSGGTPVTSSYEDRFSCQFERDHWVATYGRAMHMDLTALGGMSGGPAFAHRGLSFHLVGFIYEYSPDWDVLFMRPSALVKPDGTIARP